MKLLITGAFSLTTEFQEGLEQLGLEISFHPDEKIPVAHPEIYECVICNGLFLYNDISLFKKLKIIQLTSVGYERVPMNYIREHSIRIYNAGDVYCIPMAEFAISGILQFYKQASFFYENMKEHRWEKHRGLRELYGKNVLIVGTGNVGCEIAKRLKAFGCYITGINRTVKHISYFDSILPLDKLDSAMSSADIIILSIALTSKTKYLIDGARIQQIKEDALLINISRGSIIEEKALINWLHGHPRAGAVIDVYEQEPLADTNPMWKCSNVLLTPHNSFFGENNSKRLERMVLKHFAEAFQALTQC